MLSIFRILKHLKHFQNTSIFVQVLFLFQEQFFQLCFLLLQYALLEKYQLFAEIHKFLKLNDF